MASRPSSRTGASQPASTAHTMHPAAAAIRRNLFSNSTASTSSASLFAPPPQRPTLPPSAPSRRPPSRPVSRTATYTRPQPQPQTTSTTSIPGTTARHQSSHAHAQATHLTARPSSSRSTSRPTSRARPRSRGLGLDGTSDERDPRPEMYEDAHGQGQSQSQSQSQRPPPHKLTRTYSRKPNPSDLQQDLDDLESLFEPASEEEEPESPGILIADADVQEVEGRVYMADGELEQLTQMALHGLQHEDADGDEEMHGQAQLAGLKITTAMIEAVRGGRGSREEEAEFKQAVVEELRGVVARLEDDKWMYEEESEGEDSDG